MTDLIITEEQLGDLRGALAELREISGIKTKRVQELEAINAELVGAIEAALEQGYNLPVSRMISALKRAKGES